MQSSWEKHSVEIVEKHHAHGVDKRRQTPPQNVRTKKLIPNSFAVQIASSANEFHRKRSSSPKVDVKHHLPKITKSPCFCFKFRCLHIVLHHFQSSVQPYCQKHQSIATMPVTCRKRGTCPLYARECIFPYPDGFTRKAMGALVFSVQRLHGSRQVVQKQWVRLFAFKYCHNF